MSEREHQGEEHGAAGEAPHVHIEAAEPDRASYPWLMTVVLGFLAVHLVGLVVLWLWFQRQSEDTVTSQVLTKENAALIQLHERERTELTSYGVVNREQGLYRVPVDQGINLYLQTVRERAAAGQPMRVGAEVPGAAAGGTVPATAPAPAPAPASGGK